LGGGGGVGGGGGGGWVGGGGWGGGGGVCGGGVGGWGGGGGRWGAEALFREDLEVGEKKNPYATHKASTGRSHKGEDSKTEYEIEVVESVNHWKRAGRFTGDSF